jgi:photosystem II stability/assembly factor-like uncharacterized protein
MFSSTSKTLNPILINPKAMEKSIKPKSKSNKDFIYQFAATRTPSGQDLGYYAACLSGLHRSTDGGVSWHSAFSSLNLQEELSALAVAVSPDFKENPSLFVGINGGVLHSPDGGLSWRSVLSYSPPPTISALAISPDYVRDGTLFAGSLEDGVFRSSDGGRQWSAWNFGLMDLRILCLAISPNFASDEMLFVGTQSGIFRSTNGGRAWQEVELPVSFTAILSLAYSPDFAQDATLFAGTEKKGLLRSVDAGQTWVRLAKTELSGPINAMLVGLCYSKVPDLLALRGSALFVSQDDGKTWKAWQDDRLTGKDVATIFAPHGFSLKEKILLGYMDGTIGCI